MEEDLDEVILQEIKFEFKTVRRIKEDLICRGVFVGEDRVGKRLRSFRRSNMVEVLLLKFHVPGAPPIAYKAKIPNIFK